MTPWICPWCRAEQTHEVLCQACQSPRYATWAIQVAHHVLEHLEDGVTEPLAMLEALQARECYARHGLQLSFIAQQMRLLTKDTTALARALAKARASRTMLEVLETGDNKDKIAVMRGIQVLGDVVEHKGAIATTVTHVYETAPGKEPS